MSLGDLIRPKTVGVATCTLYFPDRPGVRLKNERRKTLTKLASPTERKKLAGGDISRALSSRQISSHRYPFQAALPNLHSLSGSVRDLPSVPSSSFSLGRFVARTHSPRLKARKLVRLPGDKCRREEDSHAVALRSSSFPSSGSSSRVNSLVTSCVYVHARVFETCARREKNEARTHAQTSSSFLRATDAPIRARVSFVIREKVNQSLDCSFPARICLPAFCVLFVFRRSFSGFARYLSTEWYSSELLSNIEDKTDFIRSDRKSSIDAFHFAFTLSKGLSRS